MNFWKPLGSFPTQGVTLFSMSHSLSCRHGQIAALTHCLAGLSNTEMHPDENPASYRANPSWAADVLLKGDTGHSPCNIWLTKAGGCSGGKPEGSFVCSGKYCPGPRAPLEGHQMYGTGHPTTQGLLQRDRSCHSYSTLRSGVSDSQFLHCNNLHKFSCSFFHSWAAPGMGCSPREGFFVWFGEIKVAPAFCSVGLDRSGLIQAPCIRPIFLLVVCFWRVSLV